jgi:hypothetical protein
MSSKKTPIAGRELIAGESVPDDFFYCTKEVLEVLLAQCGNLTNEEACAKFATLLCQRTFLNGGRPVIAEHINLLADNLPPLPDEE